MLNLNFLLFSIFMLFTILFIFIWASYFIYLRNTASRYLNIYDKITVKKKTINNSVPFFNFFNFFKLSYGYLCSFFIVFKSFNYTFFFKHLSFEPLTFNFYLLVLFFFFFLIFFFEKYFLQLKTLISGIDFFIALWIFFIFIPFALFSNTLLTFFFFLELGSISTLYLIISAKDFFQFGLKKEATSAVFFNSIFFQFWVSFFSSILLVYSILNFFFLFGSTEWVFLNFFLDISFNKCVGLIRYQAIFSIYLFIFAILIKMGVSPFFFFKIEIYKGLPLIILFFYSVLYFFIFFVLIFLLFFYYFFTIILFLSILILFFLIAAMLVFIINLFNLHLLKNFFAMSSLINSIMFFFLIFSVAL